MINVTQWKGYVLEVAKACFHNNGRVTCKKILFKNSGSVGLVDFFRNFWPLFCG